MQFSKQPIRYRSRVLVNAYITHQTAACDPSCRGEAELVWGFKKLLSFWDFKRTPVSGVYAKRCEKQTHQGIKVCGRKRHVDEKGPDGQTSLSWPVRGYDNLNNHSHNHGGEKHVRTHGILNFLWTGCKTRGRHWDPVLSDKNRNPRLRWRTDSTKCVMNMTAKQTHPAASAYDQEHISLQDSRSRSYFPSRSYRRSTVRHRQQHGNVFLTL